MNNKCRNRCKIENMGKKRQAYYKILDNHIIPQVK